MALPHPSLSNPYPGMHKIPEDRRCGSEGDAQLYFVFHCSQILGGTCIPHRPILQYRRLFRHSFKKLHNSLNKTRELKINHIVLHCLWCLGVTSLKVSIIIVWGLRLGYSSGQQIGNYCNLMTLGISIMNKNNFIVQEAKRLMGLEVHRNGVGKAISLE